MKKNGVMIISLLFILACFCLILLVIRSEMANQFQQVMIFSGITLVLLSVLLLLELKLRLMDKKK